MSQDPNVMRVRASRPLVPDYPGTETAKLTSSEKGDPLYQRPDSDGVPRDAGVPLAELRKSAHGQTVTLTSPITGRSHTVSLQEWASADPSTTSIQIPWGFRPDSTPAEKRPAVLYEDPAMEPPQQG